MPPSLDAPLDFWVRTKFARKPRLCFEQSCKSFVIDGGFNLQNFLLRAAAITLPNSPKRLITRIKVFTAKERQLLVQTFTKFGLDTLCLFSREAILLQQFLTQ